MTNDELHELTNQPDGMSAAGEEPPGVRDFPAEPFPCPACGQLLAPSCRVCVACKHAIDPAEIAKPKVIQVVPLPQPQLQREPEPAPFSWQIFVIVLAVWVVTATLVQHLMNPLKSELVLGGAQVLCALWVFYDAMRKRLPKPHRWMIGTLFLWLLIFPWYLARRQYPYRPCPFVEKPASPAVRAMLVILLAVLFFVFLRQAPPH
jgi:hypothetical protein